MRSFKQYGVFFVLFFVKWGGIGTNQDQVPRGAGNGPGVPPGPHACVRLGRAGRLVVMGRVRGSVLS